MKKTDIMAMNQFLKLAQRPIPSMSQTPSFGEKTKKKTKELLSKTPRPPKISKLSKSTLKKPSKLDRLSLKAAKDGLVPLSQKLESVSLIIPAWNEEERIADCLFCASTQTVKPLEILVVDNNSTDRTCEIVEKFIDEHPDAPVKLLHQREHQGLIPTRNYGFNHAKGQILGRIDADCMIRPNWVEVVATAFTQDPTIMGLTGPVAYYDMPAPGLGLRGDNGIRRIIYRADNNQVLLFGSNHAIRASAWEIIKDQVCFDEADVMHEDIDLSLHLFENDLRTHYSPHMVAGMSARRMDTSLSSFETYMERFKNTFDAHPIHTRTTRPEYVFKAIYPILHLWYPVYRSYLKKKDINPAERIWIEEQMELLEAEKKSDLLEYNTYEDFVTSKDDDGIDDDTSDDTVLYSNRAYKAPTDATIHNSVINNTAMNNATMNNATMNNAPASDAH